MKYAQRLLIICLLSSSCSFQQQKNTDTIKMEDKPIKDSIIVDCKYNFSEATQGSKAPAEVLHQLELINVSYLSLDNKIHQGQLLINKKIAAQAKYLFGFMLEQRFPVAKVIPIVAYNWDDKASMQDNNSYSFCYRNVDFSKHAQGLAIDINPFFNPVRWKKGIDNRIDRPIGAVYDTTVNGTFYPEHLVVKEFEKHGFRWGHNFKRNYDDHHFEKK